MKLGYFLVVLVLIRDVSCFSCEVSILSAILSGKTDDRRYKRTRCRTSDNVKALLDQMGTPDVPPNFTCFSVSAKPRIGFKTMKIKGCMPPGSCKAVEKVFENAKDTGGLGVFNTTKCAECHGDMCNAPMVKKHLYVTNRKLECAVSRLKPIISHSDLEDMSYETETCADSSQVKSLLSAFEAEGKIVHMSATFECFTLHAMRTRNGTKETIRGCTPVGDCPIVKKIFANISSSNDDTKLFKEVRCISCQGQLCNKPSDPTSKPEVKALAPNVDLSCGVIFLSLLSFLF